jgi:hypothetical protein
MLHLTGRSKPKQMFFFHKSGGNPRGEKRHLRGTHFPRTFLVLKSFLEVDEVSLFLSCRNPKDLSNTMRTNRRFDFDFLLGMHEALDVLRLLFCANLLGGERDTIESIETERENDQKMDVELTSRRQQSNDDGGNDENRLDEHEPQQEQQSSNENRVETATASPARPRTTSLSMRTSTSEQDEIESIYENPLQIKLGIEPNEYRHGHLPFDDFINEFANEKIEINKEYLDFVRQRSGGSHFSFILYPFFLSTINKIGNSIFLKNFVFFKLIFLALLNIENKVQMYRQRHSSFVHSIFSGVRLDPFFKICVRRDHLIEDALIAVCYHKSFFLKQVFFL